MARDILPKLRELVYKVDIDKHVSVRFDIEHNVYISAYIKKNDSYDEYILPISSDMVLNYWINDRYDDLDAENLILHKYKSGIEFIYDNGVRSIGYDGETTYEDDVDDILYVQVGEITDIEDKYHTIEKRSVRLTPHIDVIIASIYDIRFSSEAYSLIDERVLGYRVSDVDKVIGEMHADWRSNQLLGNLIELDTNV